MRRIAHTLAVAGAIAGLGLTALPAVASPVGASGPAGRSGTAQSSPTPAQRSAMARAEHLNALRNNRGIITGSVRGPGGAPEANVCVVASGPLATRKTFSRPDGRFIIAGLPRGAYRVEFRGCSPIGRFTGQWYGGLTRAAAAKVMVTGAAPTELAPVTLGMISPRFTRPATPALHRLHLSEAQRQGKLISRLESGRTFQAPASAQAVAQVSGRVTSRSGHPLARICVLVAPVGARFFRAGGSTSATGRYRLRVRPGRYYVIFLPTCAPKDNYAPQLWKAAGSIAQATALQIAAHQDITHIDAVLGTGAMITGRVRSHVSPHPSFRGLCIVAQGTGGQNLFESFQRVRADGTFRLPSLATGKYRVFVDPFCSRRGSPWLPLRLPGLVTVTNGKTTSGITAFLVLGGSITGTVKDTKGTKLSGVCVQALSGFSGAFTISTTNGTYRLQGLTAGSYQLTFDPSCGNRGPYAPLQLPNPVAVRLGVTTPHVDAVLQFDGSLTGTVTNSHGQPLGGICVVAQSSGLGFAFTRTRADGTYTAKKVPPGSYQVQFIPGGVFSNCGNKGNYLPASVSATVSSLASTTADGVLPTGGIIAGVVKDSHGRPIAGVCAFSSSQFGGVTATKSDGSYQLRQLFTDSYFVGFQGGCGNTESVAPLAYRNDPTFFGPTSIPVTAGQVTAGIDARLRPGATIKGAVRNQAGQLVDSVCVFVVGNTGGDGGGFLADVRIARNGRYTSANLPPGQYAVFFSGQFSRHRGCGPSPYADQQFGGQGVGGTPHFISVPGGRITTGVDTTLSLAGMISGVVTNTSGKPVSVCVTATNRRTGASAESFSGSHGTYKLTALPAGPYAVEFSSCGGDFIFFGQTGLNYANQWYKGHSTAASADTVTVRPQQTTPNIDAALTKGGLISGQVVYKPSQRPISFVCVYAFTPDFSTVSFGLTDRAGRYAVDGLSTGRYLMEFQPCFGESALAGQIRTGQLHIMAGQSVHGINEQLRLGGSVSGVTKVSLHGGTRPAPGTCVEVLPLSQTATGSLALSGQGGKYLATNLAPGSYEIVAGVPGCSSDAPTLSAGTFGPVQVASGHTTAAAGIALPVAGAIAGVVRGPGGSPLSGICAEAVPLAAGQGIPIGVTAAAGGSYRIGDLQPGRYKVMFTTGCGATGFATRWYKNARTSRQATVIKVSAATVTGGINATLPRG